MNLQDSLAIVLIFDVYCGSFILMWSLFYKKLKGRWLREFPAHPGNCEYANNVYLEQNSQQNAEYYKAIKKLYNRRQITYSIIQSFIFIFSLIAISIVLDRITNLMPLHESIFLLTLFLSVVGLMFTIKTVRVGLLDFVQKEFQRTQEDGFIENINLYMAIIMLILGLLGSSMLSYSY